jgi:transposase
MSQKKRKTYSKEFKQQSVKLIIDKGYSIAEAARNLGIDYSVLRRWKTQYEQNPDFSFPGKGQQMPHDAELQRLKRDLERVTEERDILKKALTYFAEDQK